MSYLVFARKYRPARFEDVIGQQHVAGTLLNALAGGRLAHAYLFAGPRGVGKTTMARLLARAVNCLESPGAHPCGSCDACRGILAGHDVDVIEIDAASNRSVEHVEPLIDASRYVPQRSERKVFIIDEAHMLTRHAWNALLKTLEEPPPHVLFVFCTTKPEKVIETVRSRCQEFDFRRITPRDIRGKLDRIVAEEGLAVDDEVLDSIAHRSTGGLRDAETLLDQIVSAVPEGHRVTFDDLVAVLGETPRAARTEILHHAAASRLPEMLAAAAGLVDAGADPRVLLRDLYADLHGRAVAHATGDAGEGPGLEWCLAAAELIGRHFALANRSHLPRASLDLALLAVARLGDVADLEDLVERLERLDASGPAATPPVTMPAGRAPPRTSEPPRAERRVQRLQPRREAAAPRKKDDLEAGAARAENERPRAAPGRGVSGEELARIRALPRVREIVERFGGRIEQVRREGDG